MVLFNPYVRHYTYFVLFWEFTASGEMKMKRAHTEMRKDYYNEPEDVVRAIFEIGFVVLFGFYLLIEILEIIDSIKRVIKRYHKAKKRNAARAIKREESTKGKRTGARPADLIERVEVELKGNEDQVEVVKKSVRNKIIDKTTNVAGNVAEGAFNYAQLILRGIKNHFFQFWNCVEARSLVLSFITIIYWIKFVNYHT